MDGAALRQDKETTSPCPPAERRKRRAPAEIRKRLLEAAGEEFKRSGFAGATTATIARNADVTEAQLFRSFGSKADLFREAIFNPLDAHFQRFHDRYLAGDSEGLSIRDMSSLYITELQEFLGEHSQMLMSLVVAQTYAPASTRGVDDIDSLQAYFEHGAATMTSRMERNPKVDPKLMVRVSFAAVLACVMFKDWIFPRGIADADEISAAINEFVIDGVHANSGADLGRTDGSR